MWVIGVVILGAWLYESAKVQQCPPATFSPHCFASILAGSMLPYLSWIVLGYSVLLVLATAIYFIRRAIR
jgi:hypothetical protein